MSFVSELRRRNVVRVAIVYGVSGWLILQLADVARSLLDLPGWTGRLVILLLALGFPIALAISWVYEITPEGLARTRDIDPARSIAPQTGRRLDRTIMIALAVSVIVLLLERLLPSDEAVPPPAASVPGSPASSAERLRTIAVLPFANMSGDASNEYFSEGMSEEILNTLARVEGLKVAARTASFRFREHGEDVGEIGRQLKVGAILEGSVRKEGNAVRITAQLVDVENGYHLWSRTFDRTLESVFAVQTEIAGQIVEALQLELRGGAPGAQGTQLRPLPTENAAAYELFLQGRYLWRQRNGPAVLRAVELLEDAIRLDPRFAEAHAALASALVVAPNYASVNAAAMHSRADAAADRALALDGSLAEPVAVQGMLLQQQGQWHSSEQALRRAIELDPEEATSRHWLALLYLCTGHLQHFSSEIEMAYALDPTNAAITGLVGFAQQLIGDGAVALRQYELAASMGGTFASVSSLPLILYETGQPEAGLTAARRGYAQIGLDPALADTIHAAMLDPSRRNAARSAILSAPRRFYVADMRIVDLIRIGEFERAVTEVLEAPDATPQDLLYHAWYRSSAGLRRTAAFREFVHKVGLVDYWRAHGWPDLCRPAGDDFACD